MASKLGPLIRGARRAIGLTQEQLGRRLGLKGRAVYRWERGDAVPTKHHQQALMTAIQAVNPDIATWLSAQMARAAGGPENATPAERADPPIDDAAVLRHVVFVMADDLDLPPRRVRGSLKRAFKRLRETKLGMDTAERRLDEWIASAL